MIEAPGPSHSQRNSERLRGRMAVITLIRGLKGRFDRHRAIARWTLPAWLYVSVTGVVVY